MVRYIEPHVSLLWLFVENRSFRFFPAESRLLQAFLSVLLQFVRVNTVLSYRSV